MRRALGSSVGFAAGIGLLLVAGAVLAAAPDKAPVRKATGIEKRIPWNTSRVVGSPEPPAPYRTEVAFPQLKFDQPLELKMSPGADRWYVVERYGRIFSFPNDPAVDKAHLVLNLGGERRPIYGLAFHPKFAENRTFFVTYVLDDRKEDPVGSKLVRFRMKADDPLTADPASAETILEWPSGGHNGGCLAFGPDGHLYLATGDGSGIADGLATGQDVSDLLGALLRIDVDHHDQGRKYRIPADNPFVGRPDARGEIWAYGLRQFWKFSFDRKSGDLWGGEIGQDLWEMVLKVEKGGNYGWSVTEGLHPFRPDRPTGPTPVLKPVAEHPHSDFRSITGGYVYHGTRLKELAGAYVYGDYDTGRIWILRHDGGKVTEHRELADTQLRIVAWGEAHDGELLLVDFIAGNLQRLVPNAAPSRPIPFPRRLSETGLFASTKDHAPAAGVIPYSVNSQLWSDGAAKDRFLALPGLTKIGFDEVIYPQPAPGAPRGWKFPDGTVLVKTFSLPAADDPAKLRRIETRLLHVERVGGSDEVGDEYWHGYSYVWNDDQTDAVLVEKQGLDKPYQVGDPKAQGGRREQVWRFPSRTECTLCHTVTAKYALGVNTLQMNKDHDYGGVVANQLATWNHLGLFDKPLPESPEKLPKLADHTDVRAPLAERARAYLHSNCAHCHRKWGGGNADFQLLVTLPVAETGTVGVRPNHGAFGLKDPQLLVPGSPERSVVLHRMTLTGLGRMPHIASKVVDDVGTDVVREWIRSLK